MKRVLVGLGVLFALLLAILVIRALPTGAPAAGGATVEIPLDEPAIAGRLAEAIRIPTVSPAPPAERDPKPFEDFLVWMEGAYPVLHATLSRERVGGSSLLYTWPGTDPDAAPVLLAAHYDVVPVNPGSESAWTYPPFAGTIADGYVWGRGALDDKNAVVALLEAVTVLIESGFRPERTVYLAFGHDEEIGGQEGARAIAERLESRGVRAAWSLDEGSYVVEGVLPGLDVPVASVNVAEKGYLTLELVARGEGGHSSMPPPETAVGILAVAIARLQDEPMPSGIDGLTAEFLDALAGHLPFPLRLAVANRWLFGGLIASQLGGIGPGNALVRTTTAPTMLTGSIKENVLPTEAVGTVNFRLHPRDSIADVLAHVERVVDDPRVEVRMPRPGNEASKVSRTDSEGFRSIARAVREVYGPIVVAPGLTLGGTDSRHYGRVAVDAYRFNPMRVAGGDVAGFHGTDERMGIEELALGTRVYIRLLQIAAGAADAPDAPEA